MTKNEGISLSTSMPAEYDELAQCLGAVARSACNDRSGSSGELNLPACIADRRAPQSVVFSHGSLARIARGTVARSQRLTYWLVAAVGVPVVMFAIFGMPRALLRPSAPVGHRRQHLHQRGCRDSRATHPALEYPTRVRSSAAARHRSKSLHRRFEVGPVMQTDPNDRRITRLVVEGEASVTELLIGGSTIGLFRRRVPCV